MTKKEITLAQENGSNLTAIFGNEYHGVDKVVLRIGGVVGEVFALTKDQWNRMKLKIDAEMDKK